MITTLLLYILLTILKGLLLPFTLMDNASLPDAFTNAMITASTYLSSFNDFIPVSTLLTILGLVLIIEVFINGFKLVNWAIKKIPTIG